MAEVQTLKLNKKKFAILPYKEYERLLEEIEDLKDLAAIKKRANEPRVSLEEVKKQFFKNRK